MFNIALLGYWNGKVKTASLSDFALNSDLAPMRLYQFPGNSESQSRTSRCSGSGLIHTIKTFENVGQIFSRYTFTSIDNTYLNEFTNLLWLKLLPSRLQPYGQWHYPANYVIPARYEAYQFHIAEVYLLYQRPGLFLWL